MLSLSPCLLVSQPLEFRIFLSVPGIVDYRLCHLLFSIRNQAAKLHFAGLSRGGHFDGAFS